MLNDVLLQNDGAIAPSPDAVSPIPPRAPTRARTTPVPAPLLGQALEEIATCLASLRVAEEVIRAQNVALREHRRARRAERRHYLELFAFVPGALLVTDAGGLILEINPAAARLLSGCERSRPGSPITRFFTLGRRAALLRVLEVAGGGAGWEGGMWIKPRLGLAFWASVTVTSVPTVGIRPPPCAG